MAAIENAVIRCLILNSDPLIVYGSGSQFLHRHDAFRRALQDRNAYFIHGLFWANEVFYAVCAHDRYRERYPNHKNIYLGNTMLDLDILTRCGVPNVFSNFGALVDERIYRIMPDEEKKYDAIHNAQLMPFKRHYLAARIERLACITYFGSPWIDSQLIKHEAKQLLSHADWLNDPFGVYRSLSWQEVAQHVNRARVGILLSPEEGSPTGTVEYMLCGLPVVSTESRGGRDVLFDEEYVKIVEPTPEAVKLGVQEMIERNIPPEYIREATLKKLWEHRRRLIELVQNILETEGVQKDFSEEWEQVFMQRLSVNQGMAEFVSSTQRTDRDSYLDEMRRRNR